jgi:RecA/RadA recombinase
MSLLSQAFRAQVKQTKDYSQKNEMTYSVSYPTGFLNLDFANGYIQEVNGKLLYEIGITDGSINMIISDSGVGKTTICTQIAANIVKRFRTSTVFYEQAEVGTNIQRIKNLSGFRTDKEFSDRFIVRDAGITIESIFDRVKMVHDIKVNNQSDYLYDTGMIDDRGNPIYKFEPTIFIVDSVKMVLSKKNAEAEETTNMSAAVNAKANSEYYTKMVPLCREANIIMLLINHITTDINTGFLPKKSELPYLKQGEHISGGKSLTYIQNNIFRLDIKSKLKEEEGMGIHGSIVNIDIVKSRTNISSRANCFLVFDQKNGYDSDLSLLLLLKENKILEGTGAYLKLPGYDKKFSQKQFKEVLYSDPEFYKVFVSLCIQCLQSNLLNDYNKIKQEEEMLNNNMKPYEMIISQINS